MNNSLLEFLTNTYMENLLLESYRAELLFSCYKEMCKSIPVIWKIFCYCLVFQINRFFKGRAYNSGIFRNCSNSS